MFISSVYPLETALFSLPAENQILSRSQDLDPSAIP